MRVSSHEQSTANAGGEDAQVSVGAGVRVHPGSDVECRGVIVEDFGETAGLEVRIGADQIAKPARRWAVALDDGGLAFLDSDQITAR